MNIIILSQIFLSLCALLVRFSILVIDFFLSFFGVLSYRMFSFQICFSGITRVLWYLFFQGVGTQVSKKGCHPSGLPFQNRPLTLLCWQINLSTTSLVIIIISSVNRKCQFNSLVVGNKAPNRKNIYVHLTNTTKDQLDYQTRYL